MNKINGHDLVEKLKYQSPIVLNMNAIDIFVVPENHHNPLIVSGRCLVKMLAYYLKQMIYIYHPSAEDEQCVTEYLRDFSLVFHQSQSSKLIFKKNLRLSESQVGTLMAELETLPELPDGIHDRLKIIYSFMQKILELPHKDEARYWRQMYELSGNWLERHKESAMQLVPSTQILTQADHFENLYNRRSDIYFDYYLQWGKEYHGYYQDALNEKLSSRKAHGAAWKKFVANHPVTNASGDQITPGHSRYIMKKYQKIYLDWREDNV